MLAAPDTLIKYASAKNKKSLVLFHHAGGSASFYRPWGVFLNGVANTYAVQLPGREWRSREPLKVHPEDIVAELVDSICEIGCDELTLFGHSMGGLLATFVAAELENNGLTIRRVIVSATAPPCESHIYPNKRHLSDEELLEQIKNMGGTPAEILSNTSLVNYFLPRIRADMRLTAQLRCSPLRPISAPLFACSGASDKHSKTDKVRSWHRYARNEFEFKEYEGGHFFISEGTPHELLFWINS